MALIDRIAKMVAKPLKAAGMTKDATLIVVTPGTRTAGSVSGGTNPTTTDVTARGFVDESLRDLFADTVIEKNDRTIMLLGALITGGVVPKTNDRITIESVTSTIIAIRRDPAKAGYVCLTR